tara:strand:- start:8597 stop:9028 length:432 start_codon:yes stop_codon:yes gene_type:complete
MAVPKINYDMPYRIGWTIRDGDNEYSQTYETTGKSTVDAILNLPSELAATMGVVEHVVGFDKDNPFDERKDMFWDDSMTRVVKDIWWERLSSLNTVTDELTNKIMDIFRTEYETDSSTDKDDDCYGQIHNVIREFITSNMRIK